MGGLFFETKKSEAGYLRHDGPQAGRMLLRQFTVPHSVDLLTWSAARLIRLHALE